MADLIPFPKCPIPRVADYDAYHLGLLRELREIGMSVAQTLAERARRGDPKAITALSRMTNEIHELIKLETQITNRHPRRPPP